MRSLIYISAFAALLASSMQPVFRILGVLRHGLSERLVRLIPFLGHLVFYAFLKELLAVTEREAG